MKKPTAAPERKTTQTRMSKENVARIGHARTFMFSGKTNDDIVGLALDKMGVPKYEALKRLK